jgi:hypothetical protein
MYDRRYERPHHDPSRASRRTQPHQYKHQPILGATQYLITSLAHVRLHVLWSLGKLGIPPLYELFAVSARRGAKPNEGERYREGDEFFQYVGSRSLSTSQQLPPSQSLFKAMCPLHLTHVQSRHPCQSRICISPSVHLPPLSRLPHVHSFPSQSENHRCTSDNYSYICQTSS